MDMKILVAYAGKYGSTQEIAVHIGQLLKRTDLDIDVCPAGQVTSLSSYIAIVLGSAVYAGQWLDAAADFLRDNEQVLEHRPVWLFSSGPTGAGDPETLLKGGCLPAALQPIVGRIRPRGIACFQGSLRLENLGPAERLMVGALKIPAGDDRDWDAITGWAAEIARYFSESGPTVIHLGKNVHIPGTRRYEGFGGKSSDFQNLS